MDTSRFRFRAFNTTAGRWDYFDFDELTSIGGGKSWLKHWSQWTGLTDKNGQEIFDGDICAQGGEDPFVVIFEDGAYRKKYAKWDESLPRPLLDAEGIRLLGVEKIGTIWENPELLT